jgi:hypothetical protein
MPRGGSSALDLWIPEDLDVYSVDGQYKSTGIPQFGGASGGGTWKAGVRPISEGAAWSPSNLRLAATHSVSVTTWVKGAKTRFTREILIGHHLRLIADSLPELQGQIFHTWPILKDPHWAPQVETK